MSEINASHGFLIVHERMTPKGNNISHRKKPPALPGTLEERPTSEKYTVIGCWLLTNVIYLDHTARSAMVQMPLAASGESRYIRAHRKSQTSKVSSPYVGTGHISLSTIISNSSMGARSASIAPLTTSL